MDSTESEFKIDSSLPAQFEEPASRSRWSEIVNVLDSHEMPPESEPQPDSKGVAEVVDWITDEIVNAELK